MFAGNQYRLEVDEKEYFVDLMLYHRKLQCFIAIELKIGEFEPEYKGKMEFYLTIINDTIKLPHENPTHELPANYKNMLPETDKISKRLHYL